MLEAKDYFLGFGFLLTFGLSVWSLILNYKTTRRTSFINTVTTQRIKWIEQLRQDISNFSGLIHTWRLSNLQGKPQEYEVVKEIDCLRHVIRLRLNPAGEYDKEIERLIKDIPNLTHATQIDDLLNALNKLTATTQMLLKQEWEKVKEESQKGDLSQNS